MRQLENICICFEWSRPPLSVSVSTGVSPVPLHGYVWYLTALPQAGPVCRAAVSNNCIWVSLCSAGSWGNPGEHADQSWFSRPKGHRHWGCWRDWSRAHRSLGQRWGRLGRAVLARRPALLSQCREQTHHTQLLTGAPAEQANTIQFRDTPSEETSLNPLLPLFYLKL